MAHRHEVEVTVKSARNLKNINWKHGNLLPYAVVWVDRSRKYTTKVDRKRGENPKWSDHKLKIEMPDYNPIGDRSLFIQIVHDDTQNALPQKIVGSGRLTLPDAGKVTQTVELRRPSGRPQGKVEIKVSIKKIRRYDWYSPKFKIPGRDWCPTSESGYSRPAFGYPYSTPFSTYGSTSAPPPPPTYGCSNSHAGYASIGKPIKKSSTGLEKELIGLGAVAAVMGGLAAAVRVFSGDSESSPKPDSSCLEPKSSESESAYCQCDDFNCEPEDSFYQPNDGCEPDDPFYQPNDDCEPEDSFYQPDDDWAF